MKGLLILMLLSAASTPLLAEVFPLTVYQYGFDSRELSNSFDNWWERYSTRYNVFLRPDTRPCLSNRYRYPWFKKDGKESSRYQDEAISRTHIYFDQTYAASGKSAWNCVNKFFSKRLGLDFVFHDGYHFGTMMLGDKFSATFQPVYGLEVINTGDDREDISRFTGGIRLEGGYKHSIYYLMDFRDHNEAGNGPYYSRDQLFEDRWASVDLKGKDATSYNISESLIQYYGRDLSITAGRGRHRWGPGQFGGLFLNNHAPPFDYLRFDAALEDDYSPHAIYYTFLHGFLESATPAETLYTNPDNRPRTLNSQKYFSAQRLEIRPTSNFIAGFSQGVIYGDRGVQLGYLTPLNFLYSVQHSNDDKDNFVMALDAKWRVIQGLKLYGEVFFDDVVVGDLTKSTGNNKSAYTIGLHGLVPKDFWGKFDAKAEYTKIRPFVYSHFFQTNTFSHWYSPLGYTREPNSEFFTAELCGTFYPLQIILHFSLQNHGENTAEKNVGGSIYDASYEGNDKVFPFLDGKLIKTNRLGIKVQYELLPNLWLKAQGIQIERTGENSRFETHIGFGWNL